METILLGVTAASLLVALVMSAAAWRMSREERARAGARVAALAAAASLEQDYATDAQPDPPTQWAAPGVATIPSSRPTLASAEVVEINLNAFAGEELPLRVAPIAPAAIVSEPATASQNIAATFLRVGEPLHESAGRQRGLAFAAVILFVALGGGAYWALSNGDANPSGAASTVSAAPLELVSLRHERHGSRLSLAGLVRNPSAGTPVDGLTTVVFLFDAQGGFITSGRAGVDFKRIAPGDESPFVITVEAPPNVARYRVSFRTDAGIVAHVDRRGEQPVAAADVGKD
jgi:hypothetical protein